MKLNAIGVSSSNLNKTIEFYKLIGFEFPELADEQDHIDAITHSGSARLMIDSKKLIENLINAEPKPANTSAFAIEFDSPRELNEVAQKIKSAGFHIEKEPWDAFWGQRYAVIADPDGYLIDLYAAL
jgi:catechol 2,3-dioxygenase-like lactoylglutathione lyase family enzyme